MYGEIHIDHIRPCASFDLTQESDQLKCFNYTNIQPLWAIDNLIKGASGQAVQNMNLLFGLEETTGLKLKASAF